jgi:GntR family transcriptional regulator
MLVRVHAASGVPLYLQIETQIKQAVAAQALLQDTPLPPVRKLAAELRVNPNTVARAYQNLERDGVIRTVPGGGCYVNSQTPRLLKSEKLRRLKPMAAQLAVEATQVVLSREDTVRLVEDAFDELPSAAPTNSRKDRS